MYECPPKQPQSVDLIATKATSMSGGWELLGLNTALQILLFLSLSPEGWCALILAFSPFHLGSAVMSDFSVRLWHQYLSKVFLGVVMLFGVVACGSSDDSSDPDSGYLQLINGLNDSPDLKFELRDDEDDVVVSSESFGFQRASALLVLSEGVYQLEVNVEDPIGGFEDVLLEREIDIHGDILKTFVLEGSLASNTFRLIEKDIGDLAEAREDDADDLLELQVINLSADTVSVYVADDVDRPDQENLVGTVASGSHSDAVDFVYDEDAEYRVRLTADASDELIFESNEVEFSPNTRTTIVVNDNVGPDPDSLSVWLVRDNSTASQRNRFAKSGFRVVNLVQDVADAAIVITNDVGDENLFSDNMAPTDIGAFTRADSGFVRVEARAPSDAELLETGSVSLDPDIAYSLLVTGSGVQANGGLLMRANQMNFRSVANSINVHFINALSETDEEDVNAVDFYALGDDDSLSGSSPVLSGVGYLEGGSIVLDAKSYRFLITTRNTHSILAGPEPLSPPQGGEKYIIAASEAIGGGTPNILTVAHQDE